MLGHRLDGEIHVVQRLESDRERDPAEQGIAVLGAQLAFRQGPIGRVSHRAAATLDRGVVDLHRHHIDAVASEHLDDARAHGAQAHHADFVDLARHRCILS